MLAEEGGGAGGRRLTDARGAGLGGDGNPEMAEGLRGPPEQSLLTFDLPEPRGQEPRSADPVGRNSATFVTNGKPQPLNAFNCEVFHPYKDTRNQEAPV